MNVGCIRHARRSVAVHASVIDLRENSLLQAIAKRGHLLRAAVIECVLGQFRSLAQADYS